VRLAEAAHLGTLGGFRTMQPGNEFNAEQLKFVAALIEEIDAWPAELRAFEFQYEAFGSWQFVIRRNGERTRFDYDGKDSYLSAARLQPHAGDFTKPPRQLGGIEMPREAGLPILPRVLEFIRKHAG
jgi:hypothetical protein